LTPHLNDIYQLTDAHKSYSVDLNIILGVRNSEATPVHSLSSILSGRALT